MTDNEISPTNQTHPLSRRAATGGALLAVTAALTAGVPGVAEADARDGRDARGRALRLVRRWERAWNTGDAEAMAALFTADGSYTDHAFQATFTGRAGIAQWVQITVASVADARVEVADAFADGDRVAVRWTFSGRDTGAFAPDLPPTGKTFRVPAASIFRTRGGRLAVVEDFYNLADLLRQVGLPAGPYTPPGA